MKQTDREKMTHPIKSDRPVDQPTARSDSAQIKPKTAIEEKTNSLFFEASFNLKPNESAYTTYGDGSSSNGVRYIRLSCTQKK